MWSIGHAVDADLNLCISYQASGTSDFGGERLDTVKLAEDIRAGGEGYNASGGSDEREKSVEAKGDCERVLALLGNATISKRRRNADQSKG